MDTLLQDIRYAARTLRKSPGFTTLAALCLALGIGVNTTIFSVVDSMMLRPFPFTDPDRIVAIYGTNPRQSITEAGISYPDYLDLRQQTRTLGQVAAWDWRSLTLNEGEEPERVEGSSISWNLFPMLGITPMLGRTFREDEDRAGGDAVAILSHEVWRRRYRSDSTIIGRTILVNNTAHTVVGVMPPRFKFPENQELWVPLSQYVNRDARNNRGNSVFGRLAPGATLGQARTELAGIGMQLQSQYAENRDWSFSASPIAKALVPDDVRLIVWTMMGAVTFVLLIACANVANLLLARATARHREIAVRAALGAGRGRIVRQLLTESVMLALIGGAMGVLVAIWGLDLLTRAIPQQDALPYYIDWRMDGRALAYTIGVSMLTGVLFGLAPAMQAAKHNLQEALKEGGRGSGAGAQRHRLRATLVVAEVALSLMLLVGAALFVRSFMALENTQAGFDTAHMMTMRFYMPGERYASDTARAQRTADIVRRVEAVPGVQGAFASNLIPLSGGGSGGRAIAEGSALPEDEAPRVYWTGVTPRIVETLANPLLAGRTFTALEGETRSGVAVVDQSFARKLWKAEDVVGRRFRFADDTTTGWITVIGVTRDIKYEELDDKDLLPAAFLPYPYLATRNTGISIRTAGAPAAITTAVRQAIRASDPSLPVFEVSTMEEVRKNSYWQYSLFGWMFSIFGGIALALAAVGVYGVISYGVTQRTHEIGVRVALGARAGDVRGMVVKQGLVLAGTGILFGLAGAFAITRVLQSLLFVSATDPVSFIGIALFLTAVATLASWIPARRATTVDPIVALRYD